MQGERERFIQKKKRETVREREKERERRMKGLNFTIFLNIQGHVFETKQNKNNIKTSKIMSHM